MRGASTIVIHRGEGVSPHARPLTRPIYQTSTFVFETAEQVRVHAEGRSSQYIYSRYANPTVEAVEEKIAALEHAESALVLASGMAATSTVLLSLLSAGDELVCSAAIYGGTLHLLADLFPKFGLRLRFVRVDELARPADVLGDRTRALWFESPTNPTLRCVDVSGVAAACQARGVVSIIDNTFASPINQTPLDLGVDLVMHSATKYLNGHSDITAGALAGPARLLGETAQVRKLLGTVLEPMAAYALGRGLKTLAVRVERQNATAMAIARRLEKDSRVQKVYYPGLESHPDHAIARRQMTGFGGMVCADLGGGLDRAARFFDRLQVFRRAASLGGVESLCSLPALTSHWGHTEAQLREAGVRSSMARLSVGLEDLDDLVADLDQALN